MELKVDIRSIHLGKIIIWITMLSIENIKNNRDRSIFTGADSLKGLL